MLALIEGRLITNELTLKRYRRLKRNKLAMFSTWVVFLLLFFSLTAEVWANSKPIVMKYKGEIYFPIVKEYHPTVFGREDIFVMDYRSLEFSESDWAAWPLIQWDPYESNTFVESYPSAPTKYNLMGTDNRGRDVLTRLLYGMRYSFIFALGAWFAAYLIGVVLGSTIGFFGGKLDILGMRLVEVIQTMPTTLILITIISIFTPNLFILILFLAIFDWPQIAIYMRAQFLQLRKREYVEAARALGASNNKIIFGHILPNALTPIVTFSPFVIAVNISTLAFLDYLGLGLQAPTPSWGELLDQGQQYITTSEWLVWYPSAAVVLTLTLLINIGLAVRDAFDSKSSVG
ncbi:MAG: peptide transporter permease [Pseudobdellovibrio sp.]|jgi:microcin C transport system permease protein|nr:peptide transporter permease [Pseudobdellovibrio sp.]